MALWTDILTPQVLTDISRKSLEELDRERYSLVQHLPNVQVDDTVVSLAANVRGLSEAAEFRAYDAEVPMGAVPGYKRVTVELPSLGQKVRVGEYDRLRMRNFTAKTAQEDMLAKATIGVSRAVADRMELLRGKVLASGKATINENGFIAEQDYHRDSSLEEQAGVKWDQAGADPLADLQKHVETYVNINGEVPATMLVSQKIVSSLLRSEALRKLATTAATPSIIHRQYLDDTLAAFGLPKLQVYDRKVRVNGANVRVTDEKSIIFLPGTEAPLGSTYWGTTLEATEPEYAIAEDDRPGIVVGAYKQEDPAGVFIRALAIGMPVLADANLASVLTVLD